MASEKRCFTFVWKLEHIIFYLQMKGEPIESPAFVVDDIEGTKWKLRLYPRGQNDENYIGYFLHRGEDSKGRYSVKIKYELAFIGKDGAVLFASGIANNVFLKGGALGWNNLAIQKVIETKRSMFLPNDTLTLRCRIWQCEGDMTEDVKCTVLTRIGVEKRSLKWNVKNFSALESEKKLRYQIKSIQNDLPLMSVDLSLNGGLNSEEIIRFDLSLQDETIKFCTLRLLLIDSSGKRVACNQKEMWFDDPISCKQLLAFNFTKKNLLERKSVYLPNDTLSLVWQWCFSKGVISEETEEDEWGCICSEVKISDAQDSKISDALDINNEQTTLVNCLMDNMKSLYDQHFLSDVTLQTSTSKFPAHKFILSVSSSVFKAMFSSDMKEKISDCVHIEDLDDDTVRRMLLFIYTTRVEDLTWESASNLYAAADKYAILNLKNICSSFLKKNLSPNNACEILMLADSHADDDLKTDVQEYIIKNGKQIIKSDEWKTLMQTNGKLAAETLTQLFK